LPSQHSLDLKSIDSDIVIDTHPHLLRLHQWVSNVDSEVASSVDQWVSKVVSDVVSGVALDSSMVSNYCDFITSVKDMKILFF
uniref:GCP_C_terminal domain-containing protein n=1 Tax=Haemonchus placei TaxID=6290 RepID=A0A0N4WZ10_HAEPC